MNKLFPLIIAFCIFMVMSTLTYSCLAWEDDYIISPDDAWEADSYNSRHGSFSADYDHDGTPNLIDPYDNDWYKP